MAKNDDFLAALQARRAQIQKQRAPEPTPEPVPAMEPSTEPEPQVEPVRPTAAPEPELDWQVEDLPPEPEPAPATPAVDWSVRLTTAHQDAFDPDSPMRVAGGWSDLGGDLTATLQALESRLLTAPEQASEAAHAACEQIASPLLDKLESRVDAVSMAWLSVIEADWAPLFAEPHLAESTSQSAACLLSQALRPAIAQAQSVVDEVAGLAARLATSHPDLADPWKALARDLRGRFAAIADKAEEVGQPGSTAHTLARARVQAHSRLAAMSPQERQHAAREAVLRRMSPADAAAVRAADIAAEAAAKAKAETEAAVTEWRTIAADLTQQYPLVRSILTRGHRPVTELLRTAGLGVKTTSTRKNRDGSTTKVVSEQLPTLAAIAEVTDGIELEFTPLPGQSIATWQSALGVLGVELGLTTLTVEQRGRRVVVATHDATAPEMPTALVKGRPVSYDAVTGRSYLGQTEAGAAAWITWSGNSGVVVGGTPGSGKTASMLPVFAGMAGRAELHIFDGKASFDLEPLRPIARTFDRSGDIDGPLADALERVDQLRVTRAEAIYKRTGISNFWDVPLEKREELEIYPVVVVIDECQTWLDISGMDKEERTISSSIAKGVRQIVQKGRASGIVVVLTTQKPTSESIPTVIRDNAGERIAFRVLTRAAGTAVLGEQPEGAPRPTEIPKSTKGRCITATEDGGMELAQAIYVAPRDVTAALADGKPVPDQLAVAQRLLAS
ncbi:hypothetical protein EV641_106193 [Rhodococcus sp. SMB37]|uniref:hypothetical protein n=1 Tax=Rhodococcus sp. SMB37 TaxID=2512213 RepID=UPI0010514DB1|nr:hypothetical protein [Rhodococcus sp. SMB37]TCN53547.1 hypothetical protein EV641_106193 [Rhodococcus sp. SMB37]